MTTDKQPDDSTPARHRVAVVGSSGGNLYSHGGDDPAALLDEIRRQLDAAGIELAAVAFVAASASMDAVRGGARATLWQLAADTPVPGEEAPLADVNEFAREVDATLADAVRSGEIDGLVLVSADPEDTNANVIAAAVERGLPAAGTGGTSIARARASRLNLVATSGTTGTTNRTRAVSYVAGLARHWGLRYRPVIGTTSTAAGDADWRAPWKRISIRGIMVSSLPAFIAMALCLAISKIPWLSGMEKVFDLLIDGIPVVVAAMAARRVSGLGEVGVIAGIVAGLLSTSGGILGGLVGGILAGAGAHYLLTWTLRWRFPATTANIASGGLSGLAAGLVVHYGLAPLTAAAGKGVKIGVQELVDFNPLLAGAVAGLIIWPAIVAGIYHSAVLPLVLLEMSQKGHSFFGGIDMVGLVMVSFGIMLANLIVPRDPGERPMAASGALVNFGFGTFVEAAYPFMFGDKRVFAAAVLSAVAGGTVAGGFGVEATAYVPTVVAPFVSTSALGLVAAMVVSTGCACILTLLTNLYVRRRTTGAKP